MEPRRSALKTIAAVLARHKNADLCAATALHHPRCAKDVALAVPERDMVSDRTLLSLPGLPQELLRLAAAQGGLSACLALAGRPDLPEDLLVALANSNEPAVKAQIARNSAVGSEHLSRLGLADTSVRSALADRDDLPADMYRALSEYGGVHKDLASNSSCPPDVLRHVSQAGYFYGEELAGNDATPRDVIEGLIPHAYTSLLADVAGHRTTGHLVERFMRHEDSAVRAAVASRDDVSGTVLSRLSADRSMTVRSTAASHPALPADARAKLARSRSAAVLTPLLRNPSLSDAEYDAVLRRGILSAAVEACEMERTTPEQWEYLADIDDRRVGMALAASRHTPRHILLRIAEQGSDVAVERMVGRPDAPAEAVRRMAQSSSWTCRRSAAASPAAAAGILVALAGDEDIGVVVTALKHERIPDYVLAA